jgi:hypothetical protein
MRGKYVKLDTGELDILPFGTREFGLNIIQSHFKEDGSVFLLDSRPRPSVVGLFAAGSCDVLTQHGLQSCTLQPTIFEGIDLAACCGTT